MSPSDLSSLNPAQRAAVEFDVADGGWGGAGAAAPDHRRRRLGQDQDARPSGRASDPERRRPGADPAPDLHPPGGRGDDPPGRADLRPGHRRRGRPRGRLVGHLPRRSAINCCGSMPGRSGSTRASRCSIAADAADLLDLVRDELRLSEQSAPLSEEGDLPCDLLLRRQCPARPRAGPRPGVPVVPRVAGGARGSCSAATSPPSRRRRWSTTTICCSTGRA